MIRNPIRRVLSSIRKHRVRALLMGGQACVLYGAAEFSRDTDLVIFADADRRRTGSIPVQRLDFSLLSIRGEPDNVRDMIPSVMTCN